MQVESAWTPSTAYVSVGPGGPGQAPAGQPLRVLHITDSHLSTHAERQNFERMHRVQASQDARTHHDVSHLAQFRSALRLAAESAVDLIAIGGDLLNFPSPRTAADVFRALVEVPVGVNGRRVPYIFTSGNHDWMAEGAEPEGCSFEVHGGMRLHGRVGGEAAARPRGAAVGRCLGLGSWCGGISCRLEDNSTGEVCVLRHGRQPEPSDAPGAAALVKRCPEHAYDSQRRPNRRNTLHPFYSFSGLLTDRIPNLDLNNIDVQPGFSAVDIRGVNVVALDNSNYAFDGEQRGFLEGQLARGLPTVLLLHIPLHVVGGPGRDVSQYPRVGDPGWGADIDFGADLERRPRWPREGSAETRAAVDLILSNCAPHGPVVAVLAGHEHMAYAHPLGPWRSTSEAPRVAGSHRAGHHGGAMQFSTLNNGAGGSRLLEVAVHRKRPDHCFVQRVDHWSYKVCVGEEIWQFRGEEGQSQSSLGRHAGERDRRSPAGDLESEYENGTAGRSASLVQHCSWGDPHFHVTEPYPMRYHVEAWLPNACTRALSATLFIMPVATMLVTGALAFLVVLRRHTSRKNA